MELLKQKLITGFSFLLLVALGLACGVHTQNSPVTFSKVPPLSMPERQFLRQPADVTAVDFSPDGRWLATGGDDKAVRLWNFSTTELVRRMSGHTDGITGVAFSPDGQMLASASKDRTVKLWEFLAGKELHTLVGHAGEVRGVAFSVGGKILATASADKTVKLWDVATGRELRTLSGHSEDVNAVRYSPEGIILASASSDRSIRLWNASTGELIRTIDSPDMRVLTLDFSSNAEILAAGGVEYMQVAFRLRPSQGLKLWDAQSGSEVLTTLRSYPSVTALAFRPDGGALAVGYGGEEESFDIDVIDVRTGKVMHHYRAHHGRIHGLVYSHDGAWLVSVSSDKEIRAWH